MADFVSKVGKARRTDLVAGRVNFSAEVNDFIRSLMSKVKPEAIGYSLARRKEELRVQMDAIDAQAHELLGVTTIEEWVAREKAKSRSESQALEEQRGIRHSVKEEIAQELLAAWRARHENGNAYKRDQEVAWARHRFKNQLQTIGWSPEEFVKRMETEGRGRGVS